MARTYHLENILSAPQNLSRFAPHQLRVIDEKKDLDAKLEKLRAFFWSPPCLALHIDERFLLGEQLKAMESYSRILDRRIQFFTRQLVES